ncbi:MAG: hypothetical protein ACOYCA_04905 [Eggerthellaceae bacterium]
MKRRPHFPRPTFIRLTLVFSVLIAGLFALAACSQQSESTDLGSTLSSEEATASAADETNDTDDIRENAHGISVVKDSANDSTILYYSQAYEEGVDSEGNWTHDIYAANLSSDPEDGLANATKVISEDEAQEPVSACLGADGKTVLTWEDGYNTQDFEVAQRMMILNSDGSKAFNKPLTIALGGHSGHVSATNKKNVVFWSEGWIDDGGYDYLGTGDDVYASVFDADGNKEKEIEVAVGDETRDYWPLIASSDTRNLLVWQRYDEDKEGVDLCMAILDPETGEFQNLDGEVTDYTKPHKLDDTGVQYYSYNVTWAPAAQVFVVCFQDPDGSGHILLINENGDLVKRVDGVGSLLREASPAVQDREDHTDLVYPCSDGGFFVAHVSSSDCECSDVQGSWEGSTRGTTGWFADDNTVYFASLGKDDVMLCHLQFSD